MKTILFKKTELKIYQLNDLCEESKNKAIYDHIEFWYHVRIYNEDDKGDYENAIDKAEQMQTPWFAHSYIYDYCYEELIDEIGINNCLFDEDGELLPITYYTKGNKTVKTTMKIAGQEIEIKLINTKN